MNDCFIDHTFSMGNVSDMSFDANELYVVQWSISVYLGTWQSRIALTIVLRAKNFDELHLEWISAAILIDCKFWDHIFDSRAAKMCLVMFFAYAGLDTPNDPDWERMGGCWVTASAKCRARTNGGIYGVTNICKSQSCGSRPCSYNLTSWFSLWLEIISCSCKFWLKRQNLLVLVTIYWHHYIAQICKYITTLLAKHIVVVYHASSGVLFCRVPLCVLLPYT